MSAWGDMMRRSSGQLTRTEDTFLPKDLSSLADHIRSIKENNDKLQKELDRLKEQLRRL